MEATTRKAATVFAQGWRGSLAIIAGHHDTCAMRAFVPVLLLLLLGVVRGGTINLTKMTMSMGVDLYNYAFWQSFLAALLLLGVGGMRRERPFAQMARHWKFYGTMGLVGIALPNLALFQSLVHVPAGLGVVIMGLSPIFVFVLSLIIGSERADMRRSIGLITAFGGVVLIVAPQNGFSADAPAGAILLILAAVMCYATAAVISQRFRPLGVGAMANASGMILSGALLLLPFAVVTGSLDSPFPPSAPYDPLILGHGVLAASSFSLFFLIVGLKGAVFYSQSTYVIAISGILWGMVLFGERPGGMFWLATGFIFVGLMLVSSHRDTAQGHGADQPSQLR